LPRDSDTDRPEGRFQEVIDDTVDPAKVKRVVLVSGKLYYDLLAGTRWPEAGGY
jgi:2-oxoglutarate dehydrogenase E1 component